MNDVLKGTLGKRVNRGILGKITLEGGRSVGRDEGWKEGSFFRIRGGGNDYKNTKNLSVSKTFKGVPLN